MVSAGVANQAKIFYAFNPVGPTYDYVASIRTRVNSCIPIRSLNIPYKVGFVSSYRSDTSDDIDIVREPRDIHL